MTSRRVLVLEFNELSRHLLERFIGEGRLPAFRRLRDTSVRFVTDAGERDALLNPWVQWATVHTGLTAREHGLRALGETGKLEAPTIADVVAAQGGTVELFGPMNVLPVGAVQGVVLPDPWAVDAAPQPSELAPFVRFVSAHVQEHTSDSPKLGRGDVAAFVRFMATHGGSASSAAAAVRQLVGERTHRAGRWQRAEVLDRFQWDVFEHYFQRLQPSFATFFSNSTAHFQHLHWDDMEHPRENDPAANAVAHGYEQMDRLVANAFELAGDHMTVVLCTGLSQTANDDDVDSDRDGFYRPRDLDALPAQLGLERVTGVAAVMAEQFHVFFADADAAAEGHRRLAAVRIDGNDLFQVKLQGNEVFVGCQVFHEQPAHTTVSLDRAATLPIDALLYWSASPRQGTHHPEGVLWIANGATNGDRQRDGNEPHVPLTAVAPTILALLGVEPPSTMKERPLVATAATS